MGSRVCVCGGGGMLSPPYLGAVGDGVTFSRSRDTGDAVMATGSK